MPPGEDDLVVALAPPGPLLEAVTDLLGGLTDRQVLGNVAALRGSTAFADISRMFVGCLPDVVQGRHETYQGFSEPVSAQQLLNLGRHMRWALQRLCKLRRLHTGSRCKRLDAQPTCHLRILSSMPRA